jgi:histidinol-phosphatase
MRTDRHPRPAQYRRHRDASQLAGADRLIAWENVAPFLSALTPMTAPYEQALSVARAAAEAAAVLIRKAYRGNFAVETKADATPVTEVDIAAERVIREVIAAAFPDHAFFGEELGRGDTTAEYLWLIDPIDGTKAFVRGYPMFSVQIALMHRGELVLGVSSAPCWNGGAGETAWAVQGQGAWLDGERLRVSSVDRLEQATLSLGNLARLAASPGWMRLGQIIPKLHRIRGYADFLHYHLLASGRIDAVVETNVNILDIAALVVIVREAGGHFSQLDGAPVGLETTTVLATNGRLNAPFAGLATGLLPG